MPDVEDPRLTMEEAATLLKLFAENQPPLVKAFFEGMDRHYEAEAKKSFWYKFLRFAKKIGVLSQVLFIWKVCVKILDKFSITGLQNVLRDPFDRDLWNFKPWWYYYLVWIVLTIIIAIFVFIFGMVIN